MRVLLFVLLFPALCVASDWRPVAGSDGRLGLRVVEENGGWTTADVIIRADLTIFRIALDCKAKVFVLAPKPARNPVTPGTDAELIADALCKKFWELWK